MVMQSAYKKYRRGQRIANVETDFSKGMMFTEGAVTEGYVKTLVNFDYSTDGKNVLKPRASLRTDSIILPDLTDMDSDYYDDNVAIKYVKECFEDGVAYYQIIFGLYTSTNSGKIWVMTAPKNYEYSSLGSEGYLVNFAGSKVYSSYSTARFYSVGYTKVHDKELTEDPITSFPVGAFIGNRFYFFNTSSKLCYTEFDSQLNCYKFVQSTLRDVSASEAVNYGYNMLASNPYTFNDGLGGSSAFQMEGILPYDRAFVSNTDTSPKLYMTPKSNVRIWFRCNYNIPTGSKYQIVWSWRELTTDTWTVFHKQDLEAPGAASGLPILQADLHCPSKEIMIRCEAYKYESNVLQDAVEKAMTVGFDFTRDQDDTIFNTPQENYDMATSTGMCAWENRLVAWGVRNASEVLFISELEEPTYFPYPNNVVIFDNPIIAAVELMGDLMVFTKDKIYKVSPNSDGISWTSEVVQSHLYIDDWDKHLILSVRNMLYFKSGNYYYMMVPKSQSTTGELTIAPITTPVTDFFNHFTKNVDTIFRDCFEYINEDEHRIETPEVTDLITYFNFLDYETVHNIYVYKYLADDTVKYVHFDIGYNVVDRYWKICIYELPDILFPFRNDATQTGIFATTSFIGVKKAASPNVLKNERFVQLYKMDPIRVLDLYFMNLDGFYLVYDPDADDSSYSTGVLEIPLDVSYDSTNCILTFNNSFYVRTSQLPLQILELLNHDAFISGYDLISLSDSFNAHVEELQKQMVFSNKQLLDTGFRDASLFINKRYRELQLQVNHMNEDEDMSFGMEFQIAGEPRNTDYKYEVSQVINELNEEEGIVYIDTVPFMEQDVDAIDKINRWTIDHSLTPSVNLWKVRAAISGKGVAPRLRLFTRDQFDYQLLGINWIYREMNMR